MKQVPKWKLNGNRLLSKSKQRWIDKVGKNWIEIRIQYGEALLRTKIDVSKYVFLNGF